MQNPIAQALTRLFERHRIVFWYDARLELRFDYEALELPEVEKVEIAGNEFGLKYRLLREQPKQKFLLYHAGPQPKDAENWLLDVLLAQGEFRTDLVAQWLSELGLRSELAEVVGQHAEFFQAAKRREALGKLLKAGDGERELRRKLLAVCAGSGREMDTVPEALLQELAQGRDEKIKLIERCGLGDFLWQQMERYYGYHSTEPGLRDFVLTLFQSCYRAGLPGEAEKKPGLTDDALLFFNRWKNNRLYGEVFTQFSAECADVLGIENDLQKRDFRHLVEMDYFELIDRKIISELVQAVATDTVTSAEVIQWTRQRRGMHWYEQYRHLYEAIEYAAHFFQALKEADLTVHSLVEGVQRYSQGWFAIDQYYRKFIYHVRQSGQASLMGKLQEKVENFYSNNYLLKLGDSFQVFVDDTAKWDVSQVRLQKKFFVNLVKPFLDKENKVCVIVSDALRYEIGDELLRLIRQEDRYSAELEPMLGVLPSYTQLGMAALLPHQELAIADNDSATVLADGVSTQGLINRSKILAQAVPQGATARSAEEVLAMPKEERRALLKEHQVVYIYHNHIDAVGDKRDSEREVFTAVEKTLETLVLLVKKLTGDNANNILLTADHGFIYQNQAIDESDFSGAEPQGETILFRDRRFVLGKGLVPEAGLHTFSASQLGLAGEVEVQIPKSINRLRLKGSGSRYVHGGASLQEVVVPVLKINKKRQSDVSTVEVDILRGAGTTITSGQLAVVLYQKGPVTDKVRPRVLRAGIYNKAGELISDSHELRFDATSENPREREQQVRFVLDRKADEANGQEVVLRLDEQHGTTTHYKEYKSLRYVMRRSFTSDFDF